MMILYDIEASLTVQCIALAERACAAEKRTAEEKAATVKQEKEHKTGATAE